MFGNERRKLNRSADAINALLDYRSELFGYNSDFELKNNKMIKINLKGKGISIYATYVDEGLENPKRVRITVSKKYMTKQRKFGSRSGNKVVFLGWYRNSDIFVAWDPDHVFSLKPSDGSACSVFAPKKIKDEVNKFDLFVCNANAKKVKVDKFVIAMRSDILPYYLENAEMLHSMNNEEEIISTIKRCANSDIDSATLSRSGNLLEIPSKYWVEFKRRDPVFRKTVLEAYNYTCCICGKKLGIVEAAHIIPHSLDSSNNHVTNGLALCVEHHVLYDKAILMPGPDYKLVFNIARANELRRAGLGAGLNKIKKLDGKSIKVPKNNRPSKKSLREGIKIRDPRAILKQ